VISRRVADSELHYISRYLLHSETEQIRVLQQFGFVLHGKKKDNVVSIGLKTKLFPFPLTKYS
jgi:hypothetical protein